ncbi:predicted protein [Plenodomus lingam JN3]|uniref:Predicted protein n=1 Tax=Leptosphaeria maculans (strain JN3 / isolate v23.1.3 / race Av1-4-5-6-7-8) TaxID=985895 RepID=E5A8H9_LEPMJ|nr:predicted protein [Plenodomus lingam JN3]CBX99924.1 predicted protein [Plenodomus lingam JN3]
MYPMAILVSSPNLSRYQHFFYLTILHNTTQHRTQHTQRKRTRTRKRNPHSNLTTSQPTHKYPKLPNPSSKKPCLSLGGPPVDNLIWVGMTGGQPRSNRVWVSKWRAGRLASQMLRSKVGGTRPGGRFKPEHEGKAATRKA